MAAVVVAAVVNREYMVKQMERYTKWWVILLAVFVISFGACNIIFTQMAKPGKERASMVASSISPINVACENASIGTVTPQKRAAVSQPLPTPEKTTPSQGGHGKVLKKAVGSQTSKSDQVPSPK